MTSLRHWILVISNLIIALAVSFYVFARSETPAPTPEPVAAPAPTVELDLVPLIGPIQSLEESLVGYTETLQRFNTSLVQYDFLQKEIQRMANLDQVVGNQLNLELQAQAELGEEADEAIEQTIGQMREFQTQLQAELEQRRQMLFQLIAGLEEQLARSAGELPTGEGIGDTPAETPPIPTTSDAHLAPITPPAGE